MVVRDKKYMIYLRSQPCFITGQMSSDYDGVEAAHTGTGGTSFKACDSTCLPLLHSLHLISHSVGCQTFWHGIFNEKPRLLDKIIEAWGEDVERDLIFKDKYLMLDMISHYAAKTYYQRYLAG